MNFLTETEYVFLECLALETKFNGVENTEYGSLMLESTMGRRFLVEMLFIEGTPAGGNTPKNLDVMGTGKGSGLDKIFAELKRGIKGLGIRIFQGNEAYTAFVEAANNNNNKGDEKKNALTLWGRFKALLYKAGDKAKEVYEFVKDYIKKHPIYSIAIVSAAIVFVTYMLTEQKELTKKIGNFLKNLVTYPFRKISQGISWVINKIFSNSKKKLSESVINKQFKYIDSLLESVMFIESSMISYMEASQTNTHDENLKRILTILSKNMKNDGVSTPNMTVIKNLLNNYTSEELNLMVRTLKNDRTYAKKVVKEVEKNKENVTNIKQIIDKRIKEAYDKYIKEQESKNIFAKVLEYIKRYGWEVPKRLVLSLVYKYTKLFYSKDTNEDYEKKLGLYTNKIESLQKQLEKLDKEKDKKEIWALSQSVESYKKHIRNLRAKYIKDHWIPIVATLVILAVVISVGIYYYKKKRSAV